MREAVVAIDTSVAAGLVTMAGLRRYVADRPGWVGVRQVRSALVLASGDGRSPMETRFRLLWVLDAKLPPPLVNWPVADSEGRFLAKVDLLDPVLGLVGEFDGAHHRSSSRHTSDVRREDLLRRVGLEVVTVTGKDLVRTELVVDRIRAASERAALIAPERRTYLIKMALRDASGQPL